MAILTIFEVHGNPEELVALSDETIAPRMLALAAEDGGISNTVVKTDDGIMIVNLWENEEGMKKVSEEIRPIAREAGMGEQVGWRQYEVLRHRTPGD